MKKNKDKVTEQYEFGRVSISSKRKRTTDLELVDTALLEWFQVNAAQPGLVGTILLEKAIQFTKMLRFSEEFQNKIDMNWINRIKARHSIISKRIHGESASSPLDQVSMWQETILPGIILNFRYTVYPIHVNFIGIQTLAFHLCSVQPFQQRSINYPNLSFSFSC